MEILILAICVLAACCYFEMRLSKLENSLLNTNSCLIRTTVLQQEMDDE